MMLQIEKLENELEVLLEQRNQYEEIGDYSSCNRISCDIWDVRYYLETHKKLDGWIIDSISELQKYKQ